MFLLIFGKQRANIIALVLGRFSVNVMLIFTAISWSNLLPDKGICK